MPSVDGIGENDAMATILTMTRGQMFKGHRLVFSVIRIFEKIEKFSKSGDDFFILSAKFDVA